MSIKSRINQAVKRLEKLQPKPAITRVFYFDESGFSAQPRQGPYYPTKAALFAALGWEDNPEATEIKVTYGEDGPRTDLDYPSGESASLGIDFERI